VPRQVKGPAARVLDAGKVIASRKARYTNGRAVEVRFVQVGKHFALDQFEGNTRLARIDIADFQPGGRTETFEIYVEDDPAHAGVQIDWVNEESTRVRSHYYDMYPREFLYIN
jgi:hypothetical protein